MGRKVGLGCLVLIALGCVGFGALMVVALIATSGLDDAALACDGQPVPGARGADTTPSSVLAFVRGEGSWIYAGNELPTRYASPSSAADATLVFCFEPEELVELETCNYDSGAVMHRRQPTRRVRAVDPSTGATLREVALTTSPPDACPDTLLHLGVFLHDGTSPGEAELVAAMGDLVR